MAAKKKKAEALTSQTDPKAPLDAAAFLGAAQKTLKVLADDLLARVDGSASITAGLKARWEAEQKERRTGDAFEPWRRRFVVQVGVAWILGCVFARTLEDRGLVERHRVAGPGAADSVRQFLEMAPHLTEREYLLMVFRELANLPAARDLFDARHNPVWKLAPSADGAKALLDLFRAPNGEAPAFRFGQSDTRFLGDLYQDLSDEVRERFALLQTPRFVESFILDQTLEPAIREFGLEQATIIDPTCGSGHFLLGAFERLIEHRLRAQPGLDVREAAVKALDAVYGADINPYAVAIARFRLVLAFLERGSYTSLAQAPELPLHVVVGDSLLHGRGSTGQEDFAHVEGTDTARWSGDLFALDDDAEAKRVLRKRYSAVVGNPPYITVKDGILREEYRRLYPASAFRSFSLGTPFTERFFDLARDAGSVGMITANSFMKREFGRRLISEFLPSVELSLVVNTSGAFIPGHGTPTVLLFGLKSKPTRPKVDVVLARRGEPSTPSDPEQGVVWRSIADHFLEEGFENDFITVTRFDRDTLHRHPWSLGGGGAAELKELIEERATRRLADLGVDIGTGAVTREDDVFLLGEGVLARAGIPERFRRRLVVGENVRDWSLAGEVLALWPYDARTLEPANDPSIARFLWPWRAQLSQRVAFGKSQLERGLPFTAYSMFFADRFRTPLTIAFAFVATHNHFVLDRKQAVFGRTAPIIKLPPDATEDDHLALLAYLNSSTACFWMKQVLFEKSSQNYVGDVRDKPERIHYEFAGTPLLSLPVPVLSRELADYGRKLDQLATQRSALQPRAILREAAAGRLAEAVEMARRDERRVFRLMVEAQEELDRLVYGIFGLSEEGGMPSPAEGAGLDPEARPFLHGRSANAIEQPLFKRPWLGVQGVFHRDARSFDEDLKAAVRELLLDECESAIAKEGSPVSLQELNRSLGESRIEEIGTLTSSAREVVMSGVPAEAVPYLAALTLTESGLEVRRHWEVIWAAQRDEDAGAATAPAGLAEKYDAKDFRDPAWFSLRGKLDVPRERFISYPGCESAEDKSPIYGWAGWDHLQRAQALSALYQKRKRDEGWGKDRLTPMLAGLQELVPWLKQWHNEPDPNFNGTRLGDFFADFVAAECQSLGLTLDDLKAWRPPAKTRAAKATKAKTKTVAEADPESEAQPSSEPKPKKKRTRKADAVPTDDDVLPSAASIAAAKRHGFQAE